ncbi:GAF and ANTAR domain-containing protein [Mumia sp. zg.B53]|uniref:GAF and ANTAR domain-containing protein n=1 Tax=unclassified Mumia TaxID=2621872 RepID=UPI001C6DE0B3|nr:MULTISPECIES: GAF and ANTAR domain-containing protein [unclassified Mumia]MBW9204562.1 GAF and ANTAR domain-containing protein [Mumia sp. zg.B17]MBW9209433.1 GAF and ANTAR domain-containing protein [Mumia sp. zg.B21]MBW9214038.1 GAF and ANTAR domain-containing protein [Mumia sp. zg.B53]MDD9348499.1 GAF and ANTAR domain-containing protein [Mumia sp.]
MATAARDISAAETVDAAAAQSVQFVASYIDGCVAAGITIAYLHTFDTLAASDSLARRGDELQAELGQGPSLDAVVDVPTIYSPDLATDPRWPLWGPRAVEELGIRSMVSYRLFTSAETIGSLTLYGKTLDPFDVEARELGYVAATQIAVVLATTRKEQNFRSALAGRVAIGQAQGILMERFGLEGYQAFNVLRRSAMSRDVPLREVAEELIETRQMPRVADED